MHHPSGEYVQRKPLQPEHLRRQGTCGTARYRTPRITVSYFLAGSYLRQNSPQHVKIKYVAR
jgi:hypothetical protein